MTESEIADKPYVNQSHEDLSPPKRAQNEISAEAIQCSRATSESPLERAFISDAYNLANKIQIKKDDIRGWLSVPVAFRRHAELTELQLLYITAIVSSLLKNKLRSCQSSLQLRRHIFLSIKLKSGKSELLRLKREIKRIFQKVFQDIARHTS